MKDPEFASLWASGRVAECTGGVKRFHHPLVGDLTVEFQIWLQADSPDQRLEVCSPIDQESADALTLLGTIAHDEKPGDGPFTAADIDNAAPAQTSANYRSN